MTRPRQASLRNRLLQALPADDFGLLEHALQPITLSKGLVLAEPDIPFTSVVFPETGMVSVVNASPAGRRIEVGVFGFEGMGSTAMVLGVDRTPHRTYVQVPGEGHELPVAVLSDAMQQSARLRSLLLRYVHYFLVQVSETALANGSHTVEERLARWILLVHDRMEGDDVFLTHELLSIMLGVRRTGVTLASHVLEGSALIRARRGVITVLDRAGLKQLARDCYGAAEAEYGRLFAPLR